MNVPVCIECGRELVTEPGRICSVCTRELNRYEQDDERCDDDAR